MPLARERRKLAAIVAADVVGYSRLMGRDQSGTLAQLPDIEDCSSLILRSGSCYISLTLIVALVRVLGHRNLSSVIGKSRMRFPVA
jgi:hypothetical protein